LKRPKSKAIPAREVRRLLEATEHLTDDGLSRRCFCQVFDLADGGALLVFENGRGRLYQSKDALCSMLDEVERQSPANPFRELLPQGAAFANQVPKLVRDLPARLGLEAAELNGTEASLDRIDQVLRRLGASKISSRILAPEVFAPLTAYVGEVMRNATGGRWEMRRGSDGQTWEPWIVDPFGRYYAPFAIFKELFEYGKSASIRGFVAGTIRSHLLSG
jgi:hypothetical protein